MALLSNKKKFQTIANTEEQHLASISTVTTTAKTSSKTTVKKLSNKAATKIANSSNVDESSEQSTEDHQTQGGKGAKKQVTTKATTITTKSSTDETQAVTAEDLNPNAITNSDIPINSNNDSTSDINFKKKLKSRKSKKTEADKQNISVKSSFSKFDALQKRNLIHNPQSEKEINCRLCSKPVYKMEEVKAEKSIFHKNCFRCHECNKQLKVDSYQSNEGILYCTMHFKLLFAPKYVEDTEPNKPRKPELIIIENQPIELPPDVVRASDKPDLGLEELQQLNVRSRFQVFENSTPADKEIAAERSPHVTDGNVVKRSTSILSKLVKLQSLGFSAGISAEVIAAHNADSNEASHDDEDTSDETSDPEDIDLIRSKKRTERERPIGLGYAMNDIKTKFEKGHLMAKDDRREERKHEIQNIRSRLFMGKQARIKEMYQQAVADSEQAITSASKKPEIEIEGATRSLKERFENANIFKDRRASIDAESNGGIHDEADVFASAISKKSRSIFMELDANIAAGKHQTKEMQANNVKKRQSAEDEQENFQKQPSQPDAGNVVKYYEKPEDIQIVTSDVSQKFKFFETYHPTEYEKKEFRITPPREGVVKMPTPDSDNNHELAADKTNNNDENILEKSHTTSKMLNKFREMEQSKNKNNPSSGPRPLKCFTPPPDEGNRNYNCQESDEGSQDEDDEAEYEVEEDYDYYDLEAENDNGQRRSKLLINDEGLKEAQAAARAKQLRAKFEKWEANERQRELHDGCVDIYSNQVSDDTTIESTKSIRERFENMKNSESKSPTRPRHQVNRFV